MMSKKSWKDTDYDGYLTIDYDKPNALQFSISYEPETKIVVIERRKIEKIVECLQRWLDTGSFDIPA